MAQISRSRPSPGPAAAWWLASGLASGATVAVTAFLLARYGPTGGDWSFRGNGALAAYALIPAFLAGGLTAVAVRYRRGPWIASGVAAFATGAVLAGVDALLLPLFGPAADRAWGAAIIVAFAAWTLIAPAVALWLPRRSHATGGSTAAHVAAALLWTAGLVAGVIGIGFLVPAGS